MTFLQNPAELSLLATNILSLQLVERHNIPLTKSMLAGGNEEGDLEGLLVQDLCMVLDISSGPGVPNENTYEAHEEEEGEPLSGTTRFGLKDAPAAGATGPEDSLELPFLDYDSVAVAKDNEVIAEDLIITASPEMIQSQNEVGGSRVGQPSEIVVSGGFQVMHFCENGMTTSLS